MKRPLSPVEDCCTTLTHHQQRLSYSPEHEALLAAFPAAAQAASDPQRSDEDASAVDAAVEADEGKLRRWKAEQANKALWDFGGKIKRVQQDWRRLQEELRVATPNKCARTDPAPATYAGPLLLLNQLYWEQNMGASISSITGENMFGINMYGSCAQMLRGSSSPAAAAAAAANSRAAPSNSSSNGQQQQQQQGGTLTGPGRGCRTNAAVVEQQRSGGLATLARKNPHQQQDCHQQQQQQQQQWEEVVGESDGSSPHTPSSNNRDPLLPTLPDAAATAAPAAPAAAVQQQPFDLEEIEAVCRAQGLSHLPASRRFVRALRIIKAAKQQQSVALEQQPALPLVAVV